MYIFFYLLLTRQILLSHYNDMNEQKHEKVKAILPSVDYNYFITPKQLKVFLFILFALLTPCIIFMSSIFVLTYIHRNDSINQTLINPGILPDNPLYPVKIFIEDNFVRLLPKNSDKLNFNMHLSNERLAEVHSLLIQAESSGVTFNNKLSYVPKAYAQTGSSTMSNNQSTGQLQQKADEYLTFTQLQQYSIQNNLLLARKNKDLTITYCLEDKLSQINTVYSNLQATVTNLANANTTNNINLINHDYILLNINLDSAKRIAQMADQCIGNYTDNSLDINNSPQGSASAYQKIPLTLNNSANSSNSTAIYTFPNLTYSLSISKNLVVNIPTALSDYSLLQQEAQSEINRINDTQLLASNITMANTQQKLLSDDVTGEISSIFNDKSPVPQEALDILQPIEASMLISHDTSTQGINKLAQYSIPIASTFTVNDIHNLSNIVHNTLLVPQTSQTVQQTEDLMQLYMKDVTNDTALIGNLPNSNNINKTLKKQFLSSLILVPDQLKINETSTPAIAAVISNILPLNASSLQNVVTSITGLSVPEAVNFYISQMNIDKNTINQFIAEKQSSVYIIPIILSFNQTADDTRNILKSTKTSIPNNQGYLTNTALLTSSVNQASATVQSPYYIGNSTTNNPTTGSNSNTSSESSPANNNTNNNSINSSNNQTLTPIPTIILTQPGSTSTTPITNPMPTPTLIPIPTQAATIQIIQSDNPSIVNYMPSTADCSNSNPNGICNNGQTCQNLGTSFACAYATCTNGTSCHNPNRHGAYDCGAQCSANGSECCLIPKQTPTSSAANGQVCAQSYGGNCYSWATNACPSGHQAANPSDPYVDCRTEKNAPHPDYCCITTSQPASSVQSNSQSNQSYNSNTQNNGSINTNTANNNSYNTSSTNATTYNSNNNNSSNGLNITANGN